MSEDTHDGGCLCGQLRYRTHGPTTVTGACHCRYCQIRAGSAFGVLAYFDEDKVEVLAGSSCDYRFTSESGYGWHNQFCPQCGVTTFMRLEVFPDMVGIAAGTFDPPTFWFELKNEVFMRSKAHFVGEISAENHDDTFFSHQPKTSDDPRLTGI